MDCCVAACAELVEVELRDGPFGEGLRKKYQQIGLFCVSNWYNASTPHRYNDALAWMRSTHALGS